MFKLIQLFFIVFACLFFQFYTTESMAADTTSSTAVNFECEESKTKDELLELLMQAYTEGNREKYVNISECLGGYPASDSDYIPILYQVVFSDDDIYALKVIELLENVNIPLPGGERLIHLATDKGSFILVNKLIDLGAETNVKSFGNLMPVEVAIGKSLNLFELLLKSTELTEKSLERLTSNIITSFSSDKVVMLELVFEGLKQVEKERLINYIKTNSNNLSDKKIIDLINSYD